MIARHGVVPSLAVALLTTACADPVTLYSSEPMQLVRTGPVGEQAICARGAIDTSQLTFPLLIDTGSPLSAYDDATLAVRTQRSPISVWSANDPPLERIRFPETVLFVAPLGSVCGGLASDDPNKRGGILGGDLLSKFVLHFDYPASTFALEPRVVPCDCEMAEACWSLFSYRESGGQLKIVVGEDQYTFPGSRVLLDACVEPLADPIDATVCAAPGAAQPTPPYLPSGIDVKFSLSTGFPGILIGQSAFDRLRGVGQAAALLAASGEELSLPELGGRTLRVARTTLGSAERAALAIVSREAYYGPCAELARSRRQRRAAAQLGEGRTPEPQCLMSRSTHSDLAVVQGCSIRAGDPSVCDDSSNNSPAAALLEIAAGAPVFVTEDTAVPLRAINGDVLPASIALDPQTGSAAVEMIIGSGALLSTEMQLDYPKQRVIMRCREDVSCRSYPRFVHGDRDHRGDCDASSQCASPATIADLPVERFGGRCFAP